MENTHIYVVIPVYKAEKYLAECLDSVLNQTYQDFEIIAVDDGSPDGSGEICDEYAARDSRIHVIHKKNGGAFSARAAGIALAMELSGGSGYLMSVDADDTYKPNALETVIRNIQSTNADIVFFQRDLDYGIRIVRADSQSPKYTGIIEDKRDFYLAVFCTPAFNGLSCKAIRISLFSREDLQEPVKLRLGEDLLQSIPVYRKCRKALFLADSLYLYRMVDSSATNHVTFENYVNSSPVLLTAWNCLESENVWNEKDWALYLTHSRKVLSDKIWTIARMWTPFKNKALLFDEIRIDPYYSKILSAAASNELLLKLVRNRRYFLLSTVGSGCKLLGNIRRFYRKFRVSH